MQYIRQTVTISHYIAADDTLTEEVQQQIAADVRLLLKTQGENVIAQIGGYLNLQAGRDEEARPEILVTVTSEEICDVSAESGYGQD
ncbi:hypothetical protein HWB52_gp82 [Pseudomonas phage Littlefix]|uniref:Uncharacterized protein n=1 Tax=Pseudomonas phage Littlefix TaxID=2079289 RepID=A0A2K9VHW4_9CAUD|nr:hypothetical protein HWB52_gp82 [Pseudomonas phage Littlefix]AUV61897.1 hypothetical protein PsPhLittlefix_gp82 [Pseudomonas phage Littlefix]